MPRTRPSKWAPDPAGWIGVRPAEPGEIAMFWGVRETGGVRRVSGPGGISCEAVFETPVDALAVAEAQAFGRWVVVPLVPRFVRALVPGRDDARAGDPEQLEMDFVGEPGNADEGESNRVARAG